MAEISKRQTKNGETRYKVTIRKKGAPTQTATFKLLTDAKRWERSVESAIDENRHFVSSEDKTRTFGDMIDRYIEEVLPVRHPTTKYAKELKHKIEWWKEQLGNYYLVKVKAGDIAKCRNRLMHEPMLNGEGKVILDSEKAPKLRSPATVVKYLANLSVVYTTAINEWGWLQANPVLKVAKPSLPSGRVRFLSDDERKALLEQCEQSTHPYLYTVVVLALSTGARKSEILKLRWRDVDLKNRIIRLEETKNKERRALPLAGKAFELISDLRARGNPVDAFVFPRPDGKKPIAIKRAWLSALKNAEIKDFKFHDLRHSAASYLAMNGATLAEIAEVLGHKTLQMVKRYAHMSEQHTMSVVERMNKNIF